MPCSSRQAALQGRHAGTGILEPDGTVLPCCSTSCMLMEACSAALILTVLCLIQRLEADFKAVTDQEKEEVVSLGGLHVVGTERHVSLLPMAQC